MTIKIEGWYKEMEGRRDGARSLWMTENEIVNELGAWFSTLCFFLFPAGSFCQVSLRKSGLLQCTKCLGVQSRAENGGKTGKHDWWGEWEEAGHIKAILQIKRYP